MGQSMNSETFGLESIDGLEQKLGYRFEDRSILKRALTHRSFANESLHNVEDNQRLEFLGDAVLGLVTADQLFHRYEEQDEGVLSGRQSQVVRERALVDRAQLLDLGQFIRLGRGEAASGGRHKDSLLADAMEALIAAVYLDGGFEEAERVVEQLFGELLSDFERDIHPDDYKSQLQTRSQRDFGRQPSYRIVDVSGPPHDREFEAIVEIDGERSGTGIGTSKQDAEQSAAAEALANLNEDECSSDQTER